MPESLGVLDFLSSLTLIVVVLFVSRWKKLELESSVLWATLRAAVQLIAVGLVFTTILTSELAMLWAWLWLLAMVLVASVVIARRAQHVPKLFGHGLIALTATTALVIATVFGLSILELTPVALIVIAGITIGNTMPAVVLGTNRMAETLKDGSGQVEALLALGMSGEDSTVALERRVLASALTPQIERTKVVGIIALPGAMTGLLLAGTEPIDAVIIQLVVMFLVLGSVAVSVVVMTRAVARKALTDDLRIAPWVLAEPEARAATTS